jgi:hypothetical protein
VVSFKDKFFTAEVIAELGDPKIQREGFLFEGIPVGSSTGILIKAKAMD